MERPREKKPRVNKDGTEKVEEEKEKVKKVKDVEVVAGDDVVEVETTK